MRKTWGFYMAKIKKKGKLYYTLQAFSSVPMLILGLIIMMFSFKTVQSAMYDQVHTELQNMTDMLISSYDMLYPGDYTLQGDVGYRLFKGEQDITSDYSVIDKFHENTGVEFTVFYEDTRILTTICDEQGQRIVGTGANSKVLQEVFYGGSSHFYTNTTISNVHYFAYYAPLRNSDGTVVGMVYAGMPCAQVNWTVKATIFPILIISLCSIVIVCLISSSYTHKILTALHKIRTFLAQIASGNLNASLGQEVLSRNDELSEIGISALSMQRSLRNLLEQDTLTGLSNRRFGDQKLSETHRRFTENGTPYVLCIGDIDYFKSVNDTYGHECGDEVLKAVGKVMRKEMHGSGCVARWGGEEFLLIYEGATLSEANAYAEAMLSRIRELKVPYEGNEIRITMTLGLAQATADIDINDLLKEADLMLYKGKKAGRNCVISE